jgi:2-C-methyl-D-erythritol 2,4-cyclodiphosphate synthase
MLIGQGYDAHRFAPCIPLVLGGVRIEHDRGLAAHSDGDVLVHALCDALLGAAGLGDIGHHFPDSEEQYRGIDSRLLLRRVVEQLQREGLQVHNADLTVVAQQPKLASHIPLMRSRLAADLGLDARRVNVKATTTEGMGFAGRSEGIACYAVALLEE